jgi:LysM repeat protein
MPSTTSWQGSINRPDALYSVKAGDSLSKISRAFYYGVPDADGVKRIAQANGLDPAKPIQIGQMLKIPGGGSNDPTSATDTPAATVRKESTPAPAPAPVANVIPGFPALDLHDWRVWAGGGLVLGALYLLWRSSQRR